MVWGGAERSFVCQCKEQPELDRKEGNKNEKKIADTTIVNHDGIYNDADDDGSDFCK